MASVCTFALKLDQWRLLVAAQGEGTGTRHGVRYSPVLVAGEFIAC